MVLSDSKIKEEIKKGNIVISDFDESRLNPNSYNLRLDKVIKIYENRVLDMRGENKAREIEIPEEGYVLQPGFVYIASTIEHTETTGSLVPVLEGRSSIGRLGIFTHVTAGWGDTGFKGRWTLEIVATQPVKIYPEVEICQIVFHRVEGKVEHPYHGKYQNQKGAEPSKMFKDFSKIKEQHDLLPVRGKIINQFRDQMLDHFINNNNGRKAPIMPIKNPMLECNRVSQIDTNLQDRKMTAEELESFQCKRNILDARIRSAVDFALGYGSTEKDSITVTTIYKLLAEYDESILHVPYNSDELVTNFVDIMKRKGVYDESNNMQDSINEAVKRCVSDNKSKMKSTKNKSAYRKLKELSKREFDENLSKEIYDILLDFSNGAAKVYELDIYDFTKIVYKNIKNEVEELNKQDDDLKLNMIIADSFKDLSDELLSKGNLNLEEPLFKDFKPGTDEGVYDTLYKLCRDNEYSTSVKEKIVDQLSYFDQQFNTLSKTYDDIKDNFTKLFYDKIKGYPENPKDKIASLYLIIGDCLIEDAETKLDVDLSFMKRPIPDDKKEEEKPKKPSTGNTQKSKLFASISNNWRWDKETLSLLLGTIEETVQYVYEEEYDSGFTEIEDLYEMINDRLEADDYINTILGSAENGKKALTKILSIVRSEI